MASVIHAQLSGLAPSEGRLVQLSGPRPSEGRLVQLSGPVFSKAAGIGYTELCRLLRTLVEPLQPTGYYKLIVGI